MNFSDLNFSLPTLLAVNLACALFMTGLIWFVQVVHYPLFLSARSDAWPDYHRVHSSRTTWIVLPVMLIELMAAVLLVVRLPSPASVSLLALLVVIWLSTFFVQVPLHNTLGQQSNVAVFNSLVLKLVLTNWLRTIAWSARSVLLLFLLMKLAK